MAPNSDKLLPEFSFRTRQTDWNHLKRYGDRPVDALIIGGGIVGSGLLRELSLRGVKECYLFEKHDFASATSGASSKLIHAGIRYLEQAWQRMKEGQFGAAWRSFLYVFGASNERRILGEMAPHLIKPKPIYFLIGESDQRSVGGVFLGVWFYYLIQLLQGQFFRPPRIVFRKEAMKWIAPAVNPEKIRAIFSFWDSETDDARLVIETLQSAINEGGHALNYVRVLSFAKRGDIVDVELKNELSDEVIHLSTKILINAAGPYVDEVRALEKGFNSSEKTIDRVAGAHINIFPAVTDESYYITAGDGRLVFVLKRNEDGLVYSRIGTTERPLIPEESSDNVKATEKEIEYLKALVSEFFPKAEISDETIISTDAGIRPLMKQHEHHAFQKSREHRIIEDQNVFHIIGVKLTDFRKVAREVACRIPWAKYHVETTGLPPHVDLKPLRESTSTWLYEEENLEQIIHRTMVVRKEDYLYRRRGLRHRVLQKKDPQKLEGELRELGKLLGTNN